MIENRYTFIGLRPHATRLERACRNVAHHLGIACRVETYGALRKTIMVTVSGDNYPVYIFTQWWRFRMARMGVKAR